ncbi:hypothetical protein HK405_001240, partial [Cladochytrium tenue]
HEVSPLVNKVGRNTAECIVPARERKGTLFKFFSPTKTTSRQGDECDVGKVDRDAGHSPSPPAKRQRTIFSDEESPHSGDELQLQHAPPPPTSPDSGLIAAAMPLTPSAATIPSPRRQTGETQQQNRTPPRPTAPSLSPRAAAGRGRGGRGGRARGQ